MDASAGVASGSNGLAQGTEEVGNEPSTDTSTANASAGDTLGGNGLGLAQPVEELGSNKELSSDTLSVNTLAGVASGSNELAEGIEEGGNKESRNDAMVVDLGSNGLVEGIEEGGNKESRNDAMVVDTVTNNLDAPPSNLQSSKVVESDKNTTVPAPIANSQNVDSDTSKLGVTSISGNMRNSGAASYVTETRAYFQGISEADGWVKLVNAWLEFEKTCHVRGVSSLIHPYLAICDDLHVNKALPTLNRPTEVSWWLKRGRKVDKLPVLLEGYGERWKKWWIGIQPKVRITSEWPPSREVSDDTTTWDVLRRVGPTGFFIVMMTLSWWGKAVTGVEGSVGDDSGFQVAVEEVNWVVEKMLQGGKIMITKRPAESESDGSIESLDEPALKR